MKTRRPKQSSLVCFSIAALLCAAPAIGAELCGDADGSDTVTVTDGVSTLRTAAGLSSPCADDTRRCDVDGNDNVSVSDGVLVLRIAADLSSGVTVPCPGLGDSTNPVKAEIFGALTKVVSAAGAEAVLTRGTVPAAGAGAPATISGVEARFQGFGGATVTVPLGADAAASAAGDDALIVAAVRPDGSFMEGFYELPLIPGALTELLELTFANTKTIPLIRLATRIAGIVSRYEATLVSFSFFSDTPLFGFDVRAQYPVETGAFVGAADSVSCRIPALDLGLDDPFCADGDDLGFIANNVIDEGELVLIVVNCQSVGADPFVDFPVEIVCAFAAAPGRTLAPAEDIQVRVNEVVVDRGAGPEPGDPSVLGVTTGVAVRQ